MLNTSTIIKKEEVIAKKLPWVLGRHAFLVILVLVLLGFVISAILFYNYVTLIEAKDPQDSSASARFNSGAYQKILKTWEANQKTTQDSANKNYTNPFTI